MINDLIYKQEIEKLQSEIKFLTEKQEKFNFLTDMFSNLHKLPDLESIYTYIVNSLQKIISNTIILY